MDGLPENYLKGIELFNAGRFYECHEVLEEIWLKAEGTEREFLHALIQQPPHFTTTRGNLKGAEGVFIRAKRNFDSLPRIVMRLDIPGFVCLLEDYLAGTRRPGSIVNPHNSTYRQKTIVIDRTRLTLLGIWLGVMCYFSFVVAPAVFSVLPSPVLAGSVVSRTLGIAELIGIILGLILHRFMRFRKMCAEKPTGSSHY
ncbi:MAG: DUF309 domain-containing protein [Acidobacteria bacterium]|nr:DUF309 domain-containing protein [Acidobacteriota bacterium]